MFTSKGWLQGTNESLARNMLLSALLTLAPLSPALAQNTRPVNGIHKQNGMLYSVFTVASETNKPKDIKAAEEKAKRAARENLVKTGKDLRGMRSWTIHNKGGSVTAVFSINEQQQNNNRAESTGSSLGLAMLSPILGWSHASQVAEEMSEVALRRDAQFRGDMGKWLGLVLDGLQRCPPHRRELDRSHSEQDCEGKEAHQDQ